MTERLTDQTSRHTATTALSSLSVFFFFFFFFCVRTLSHSLARKPIGSGLKRPITTFIHTTNNSSSSSSSSSTAAAAATTAIATVAVTSISVVNKKESPSCVLVQFDSSIGRVGSILLTILKWKVNQYQYQEEEEEAEEKLTEARALSEAIEAEALEKVSEAGEEASEEVRKSEVIPEEVLEASEELLLRETQHTTI